MSDCRELTNHPAYRIATDDQRGWLMLTYRATRWQPGRHLGPIIFLEPDGVHALCDRAFAAGPDGIRRLGQCLAVIDIGAFPRPVFSGFLTRLVRSPIDRRIYGNGPIRESGVSIFGALVEKLLRDLPRQALEWFVDMGRGSPEAGLERQPTTVLRGLIFSPDVRHQDHPDFWDAAAADGAEFPDRVFCDPCHPDDGPMLGSYYLKAFGLFFSHCPVSALTRFAAAIKDHFRFKAVRVENEIGIKCIIQVVPAADREIAELRQRVLNAIINPDRRQMVADILFPPANPRPPTEG